MLNPPQLENHYKGIGGSMAAAILGLDKYSSPVDAYLLLTDKDYRAEKQLKIGQAAKWGNLLEPIIITEAANEKNWDVYHVDSTQYHSTHNFLIAHPDGFINDHANSEILGLEIKTRSQYRAYEYGDDDTDAVLDTDMIQCQHYMSVTGLKKWHLVALIGGQRLRYFVIERNDALINTMTERLVKFWNEHILTQTPPEPETSQQAFDLYPYCTPGKSIVATEAVIDSINHLKILNDELEVVKAGIEKQKNFISRYFLDAENLNDKDGNLIATYKLQSKKSYTVKEQSYKVLRIK